MTAVHEKTIYAKLEAIKDVRAKTIQLEKLKMLIVREIENSDAEQKCLAEYRREMELLLQEKMSHVEELRQIHADFKAMENVIRLAEENRSRSLNIANRIHEEYAPLKGEIDDMRREYLGLNPLPDLHEEEGSVVTPNRFQTSYYHLGKGGNGGNVFGQNTIPSSNFTQPVFHQPITPEATVASLSPAASTSLQPPVAKMRTQYPQSHTDGRNRLQLPQSIEKEHPTFRQQLPPMKSCSSCYQQIHRNCPICPLCKAKSRSRNPKKPKKKDDQSNNIVINTIKKSNLRN